MKELQTQSAALEFEISLKAVSVLRYITDHTERYGSVWTSNEVQGLNFNIDLSIGLSIILFIKHESYKK